MRVLRTAVAALVLVALTSSAVIAETDGCEPCGDSDGIPGGGGGDGGWDKDHPPVGPPYCDDPDWPNYKSVARGYWLTSKGDTGGGEAPTPIGSIKTHQMYQHWCEGPPGVDRHKEATFWMPLVNPDTIVFQRDLLAAVETQLVVPEVTWLNLDKDHGWLWVRVEHFASIGAVPEIYVEDTAGDEATGIAKAWIRATPVSFSVRVPGVDGMEGVSSCDLARATSAQGCGIRFTHASSIDPSGEFTLRAELKYVVESNSGKYTGITFRREGEDTIVVAEAMAVSGDS